MSNGKINLVEIKSFFGYDNGKITEVTIKKLFGYEGNDYTVKLLPEEPVTFIYGFNGIGKTTFLRLLDAVMKCNFTILDSILFESITVKFDTGSVLTVRKTVVKGFEEITVEEMRAFSKDETGFYFPIVYEWDGEEKLYFDSKWNDWLNSGETDPKMTMALGPDKFSDFYKYNHCPLLMFVGSDLHPLDELQGNYFLPRREVLIFANKDYNREFEYNSWYEQPAEFFTKPEQYDTFYLDRPTGWYKDEILSDIKRGYVRFPDKIDSLVRYIKNSYENDWTQFENDFDYEHHFEMRSKVFTDVINKRSGLTDKFININSLGELTVTVRYGKQDFPLDIKKLSSGEKNLLLLYAHIIFADCDPAFIESGDSTLFLIDEPEVSMHPDWLMDFVDNLEYINKELKREEKCQFIIATHSLAITYDHNEMMTPMRRCKNV